MAIGPGIDGRNTRPEPELRHSAHRTGAVSRPVELFKQSRDCRYCSQKHRSGIGKCPAYGRVENAASKTIQHVCADRKGQPGRSVGRLPYSTTTRAPLREVSMTSTRSL